MNSPWNGRHIIVTGASSGIGAAFVRQLAREGARCTAVARRREKLEALAEQLKNEGAVIPRVLVADLLNKEDLERVLGEVASADGLINNAGFGMNGRFLDSNPRRLGDMLRLDYHVPVLLSEEAAACTDRGHPVDIMNVASIAAMVPTPWHGAYSAAKAGLLAYTTALHDRMKRDDLPRIMALCPGVTDTEFFDAGHYHTGSLVYRLPRQSAVKVAQSGLRAWQKGQVVFVPGLLNRGLMTASRLLPQSWVCRLAGRTMSTD